MKSTLFGIVLVVLLPKMIQSAESADIPATVEQAVQELRQNWLSKEELDWILRNPKGQVVATLHLPFGMQVRNEWRLWGGNKELLASCGVEDAEECSGIIFMHLWESLRKDADPLLVKQLDCHFQFMEQIHINYKGFYKLRIGEILTRVQRQIDDQLPDLASRFPEGCSSRLDLQPKGDPNLSCWSRVEFSEDGRDPVSLDLLLGWLSFRNSFEVNHFPPVIQLDFYKKCSWPEQPREFKPQDNESTDSTTE